MNEKIERMLDVCRRYAEEAPAGVMVKEPYLPRIPQGWNGVLVLAEAQQLAGAETYRNWLLGLSPEQSMNRLSLSNPSGGVGVGPWDDGTVKLAVQAMMYGRPGFRLDEVAVGNAVPWSCKTERDTNANPTPLMQQRAAEFWQELLAVWQPEFKPLILLGKIAANVTDAAGINVAVKLRLPSPNNIQRVRGMFDQQDLLERYPEVRTAGEQLDIAFSASNVFFACHAVSLGKEQLRRLSLKS